MPLNRPSSQREILDLIKRSGEMTVRQLSETIGITPMGVRQHLSSLQGEGLIEARTERQKVGRPIQIFSLTREADIHFPSRYAFLLVRMLDVLTEMEGEEKVHQLLEELQKRQNGEYLKHLGNLPRNEKFHILAEIRDGEGYMCEVLDFGNGDSGLIEHHCPISEVARKYPEICLIEKELFESLLETTLEREKHMVGGDKCCKYVPAPEA